MLMVLFQLGRCRLRQGLAKTMSPLLEQLSSVNTT
jgi:hypothetical protein